MNAKRNEDPDKPPPSGGPSGNNEFSDAIARLEKAVAEVVSTATGQLSERAASLLDDTSQRLEAEIRSRSVADDEDRIDHSKISQRRHQRHRLVDQAERVNPLSGRLYRDKRRAKVAGVCSGVARYLSFETWAVRLAAVTGLIFVPGLTFPAYWVAYFLMDDPPNDVSLKNRSRRGKSPGRDKVDPGIDGAPQQTRQKLDATRALRYAGADLTQAELRLRRLESFVTSDQYELHKELARIGADEAAESAVQRTVSSQESNHVG